ncbi:MAG: hypothetical protein IT376_22275 [Polyangiaceae bacterium]|nr:hypothetical protein [Polyangiaceae bacterium]
MLLTSPAGLWWAVHRFPTVGPIVADSLRAVFGVEAVARLEELVYGAEDRVLQTVKGDEAPQARWETAPPGANAAPTDAGADAPRRFVPANVGPVLAEWSAPGDGVWVPMPNALDPSAPPRLHKTLLHPDRNRSWAEVFVVVGSLDEVEVRFVIGRHEPKSQAKEAAAYARPAVVPEADRGALLLAFNGGFKTEHGWYGVKQDGITFVKPREKVCTFGQTTSGELLIRTWTGLAAREPELAWYRQAPQCLVEDGALHVGLAQEKTTYWGATLDGETVIRRSAVGLDGTGRRFFVAITNHTTARAVAIALKHAGADHVAQLDVNWSYPKIVTYERVGDGALRAVGIAKGFEHQEDEYVGTRSQRDFFYVVSR